MLFARLTKLNCLWTSEENRSLLDRERKNVRAQNVTIPNVRRRKKSSGKQVLQLAKYRFSLSKSDLRESSGACMRHTTILELPLRFPALSSRVQPCSPTTIIIDSVDCRSDVCRIIATPNLIGVALHKLQIIELSMHLKDKISALTKERHLKDFKL